MTFQQLQVFSVMAKELNYTKAAKHLFMSRQAVKQNISALEMEYGMLLFQNDKNHLTLTEFGQKLAEKSAPVLHSFNKLKKDMKQLVVEKHSIRLGISASVVPYYLSGLGRILKEFQKEYPGICVEKIRIPNDKIAQALYLNEVDAAIVLDLGCIENRFHRVPITRHRTGIMVSNTHPFWNKNKIKLQDLDGGALILPGSGTEFSPLFEMAEKAGLRIEFETRSSVFEMYLQLNEKQGVALNRYIPGDEIDPEISKTILLEDVPDICTSYLTQKENKDQNVAHLLRWIRRAGEKELLRPDRKEQ